LTLADAIRAGALVRYLYYPLLVNLTENEGYAYLKLTKRIGWVLSHQETMDLNHDDLRGLVMQRARLVGSASNKLNVLRELMKTRMHTSHTLFYCGDGTVEQSGSRGSNRQLEAVSHLLGSELGYRVNTYTADTAIEKREELRRQFESGELQGLVAIRCLDEGVDIPAIKTAVILASSGNPRQFIQRRGRILRPHPNKDRATLFDTIVMPPKLDREALEIERNILKKELRRFIEFADLADNAGEARMKLLQLQKSYGLLSL
jgi:superfamily II DNA or RNA helicase